jgi:exopolysaccharide biosynthesis polyprenyl glycosylphosphotransferase
MNNKSGILKFSLIAGTVLADTSLIVLADIISFSLRYGIDVKEVNFNAYKRIAIFAVLLRIICLYIFGLYERPKYKTNLENLARIIKAVTVSSLIIVVIAFYTRALAYPRSVILLSWIITIVLIMAWRVITRYLVSLFVGRDYFVSNLLIIGTNNNAIRMMLQLTRRPGIWCRLVGYVATGHEEIKVPKEKILGTIEDIPEIIKEYPIDEVMVSSLDLPREKVTQIFSYLVNTDIIFKTVPDLYESVIGKVATTSTESIPLVEMTHVRYGSGWYRGFKRVLDLILSIVVIAILGPLIMLPIALIVKLTSPGPAFHKQQRSGLHCRPFTMLKFRTMVVDSEEHTGPVWADVNDRRVTHIGRFLRKLRLDELPQFFNVLKGDMSIVGPRPERPHFVASLLRSIPFYSERLEVKPGITGWAQVNYSYASSLQSNAEKLIYDLFYIENISLPLDLWVMLKTVGIILRGKGI